MDWFKDEKSFMEASGYDIDGKWYPRVTKIIGIKAKPALYRYYGEAKNYKAAQDITKKSAEEGTLMHEVIQDIMVGKSPEIPSEIKPAVEATVRFLDEYNIQIDPEYIEKRVVNFQDRYAGTIDALALINGKFGVLDIKTSQAIYRDYNLQTAAYMTPLSEMTNNNLQTRWILRIDQNQSCLRCNATRRVKGGREKIKRPFPSNGVLTCPESEHDWSDLRGVIELKEFPYWQNDFKAFLSAKHLWEWENAFWLKKIGYKADF
jgi:hypothetical protein